MRFISFLVLLEGLRYLGEGDLFDFPLGEGVTIGGQAKGFLPLGEGDLTGEELFLPLGEGDLTGEELFLPLGEGDLTGDFLGDLNSSSTNMSKSILIDEILFV